MDREALHAVVHGGLKKLDMTEQLKTTQHVLYRQVASGPITSCQIDGETMETVTDVFSWAPKALEMVTTAMKLKDVCSLEEKL